MKRHVYDVTPDGNFLQLKPGFAFDLSLSVLPAMSTKVSVRRLAKDAPGTMHVSLSIF